MKIILIISLLITISCKSQINNNLNIEKMKYFNENNFKGWKTDTFEIVSSSTTYLIKGSNKAEISIGEKTKQIKLTNIINPYMYVYIYNAKTNILMKESTFFYGMPIGKTYTYDEIGRKVTKIQNWEIPYKILVEDLIKIGKEKLGIDLMDLSLRLDVRKANHTQPVYVIIVPVPNTRGNQSRYITISGKTGEILFDKTIYSKEELKENLPKIYQSESKTESRFFLDDDEYHNYLKNKEK